MLNTRAVIIAVAILIGYLSVIFQLAVVMLLPEEYFKYRFIGLPVIFAALFLIATLRANTIDLKEYLKKISSKEGYPIISVIYGRFITKKYIKISSWLTALTIIFFILSLLIDILEKHMYLGIFPLTLALLLFARSQLVKLRIEAGTFGTNSSEAKELINFILSNYKDINFTDSNGNTKKAFLPENLLPEQYNAREDESVIYP